MPFNPLAPVTDYQSMLNRIFWFTTASTLVGLWMLRLYVPAIDAWLSAVDFTLAFGGSKALPIPGGYLLPALVVGLFTRIYRLHARVSNLVGIRESFDVHVIIEQFAHRLHLDTSVLGDRRLLKHRHELMRRTFYPFVSGAQPQVDSQLIQQALDAWSWFWVGIEATLVFALTGALLAATGAPKPGLYTFGAALLAAAVGLPPIYERCRQLAVAQVRAILDDQQRAATVRSAFDELADERPCVRLAA